MGKEVRNTDRWSVVVAMQDSWNANARTGGHTNLILQDICDKRRKRPPRFREAETFQTEKKRKRRARLLQGRTGGDAAIFIQTGGSTGRRWRFGRAVAGRAGRRLRNARRRLLSRQETTFV